MNESKRTNQAVPSDRDEMAFQAHLVEYQAIRDQINQSSQSQNQLMNYAIAIVAATVTLFAIGNSSVAGQQPILFLISSIMTTAISWAISELEIGISSLGKYLQNTLSPKVQEIIGQPSSFKYSVLKWEEARSSISFANAIYGVVASGKILITLVPSILFIILFRSMKTSSSTPLTSTESTLFWIAVAMQAVLYFSIVLNVYSYIVKAKPKHKP